MTVLATMALAGCGGGGPDGPSAKEKRAALDKWTRTADAACEKANTSIAKRGWPVNLVDLDRLTVRAVTEVQAASKTIRAQEPPAGSEDKVRPFVRSLEELDATMKTLSNATERFKIARLNKFLPELSDVADTYRRRLDDLKPPYWARRQSDDYVVALRTLGRVLGKGAKALSSPPITPAEGQAFDSQLARAGRAERKGIKKLLKSIGAVPTVPGRGGGDEAPAGDETEAA